MRAPMHRTTDSSAGRLLLASVLCLAPLGQAQPTEPGQRTVHVLYGTPGCVGNDTENLNLVGYFFSHFDKNPGAFYVSELGGGAFRQGGRYLLPENGVKDPDAVQTFLAGGEVQSREVLEELPVLVSPWEIDFQYPFKGHADWLEVLESELRRQGDNPWVSRQSATLVRYTNRKGQRVLALELDAAPSSEATAPSRIFAVMSVVAPPGDQVKVYSLGRTVAKAARVKAELARLRAEAAGAPALLLHPGGAVLHDASAELQKQCGEDMQALAVDAIVPRQEELALGGEAFTRFAADHRLPYVAANLRMRGDTSRAPFPGVRVKEWEGLTVAVVGVIGREQLSRVPPPLRSQWELEDPRASIRRALDELHARLRRRPDLVIALVGASVGDGDLSEVAAAPDVDLVVAESSRWDLVHRRETVELPAATDPTVPHARESAYHPRPSLVVRTASIAVGRVEVVFQPRAGRFALSRLTHEARAVLEDGPVDAELDARRRPLVELAARKAAQVLLPDVAPLVEAHPELHPLAWGPRVLSFFQYRAWERRNPAHFTDPLWMRLVTNALREELGADVSLSLTLPRNNQILGPVGRKFVEDWLPPSQRVRVAELTGAALGKVAQVLKEQQRHPPAPHALLFASGLDAQGGRVAGTPLEDKARYRVALTDSVLESGLLDEAMAGASPVKRFRPSVPHGFREHPQGEPLPVRAVVLARLERMVDPNTRSFDPAHLAEVERLLLEVSTRRAPEWRFRVDELSVSGSAHRNTDNIGQFAATRETRATTPNLYSLRVRADVAAIYDTAPVSWETGLKSRWSRIDLDLAGTPMATKEEQDDLVLYTEARMNKVTLLAGEANVPIVPFLRATYDTELTPTQDGTGALFPHQRLLGESIGAVAQPGPVLQEVRLGGLVQQDFSEPTLRNDFGVVGGYKLRLPLGNSLALESQLEARYLFPDADDRATDLALRLTMENKLVVPVTRELSFFLSADLFAVSGKLAENRAVGGSALFGVGLQFAHHWRVRP